MTPIEKNIIVVDELGNEYEATYPKRAKGLVKSGRARFIGENKICLACPPDKNLEEHQMSNNGMLTSREIFNQVVALQNELIANPSHSMENFSDAVRAYCENDNEEREAGDISEISSAFIQREVTFQKMLDLYTRMYQDTKAMEQYLATHPQEGAK